jgi:hypothetical protein
VEQISLIASVYFTVLKVVQTFSFDLAPLIGTASHVAKTVNQFISTG